MEAAAFVRLRAPHMHRYSGFHPSIKSYSFPRRQRNAALTLSSTVPARGLTCNAGSQMEPIDDDADTQISDLDWPLFDKWGEPIVNGLQNFCNDYAFKYYQVLVEVRWLLKLSEIPEVKEVPTFSQETHAFLENLIQEFNVDEALEVKKIEEFTNHDVKAVVYYLKQKCKSHSEVLKVLEFFHSTCTSEDINNLAYGLLVKDAVNHVMFPVMMDLCKAFFAMAKNNAHIVMLSHTHGQASRTTLGKEMAAFAFRLRYWAQRMSKVRIFGKFAGVVGKYSACRFAYHDIGWRRVCQEFVTSFGLQFKPYATQIESHHHMVELFDSMVNFNNVLVDFTDDVRSYTSLGYFEQMTKEEKNESYTMLNKLDPFDFANSRGDLLVAKSSLSAISNSICSSHRKMKKVGENGSCMMPRIDFLNSLSTMPCIDFANSLSDLLMAKAGLSAISRNVSSSGRKSDLTDILMPFTRLGLVHSLVAYKNFLQVIEKLRVNESRLAEDLEKNWAVLAEAIQTVMERYAVTEPYEKHKELIRGRDVNKESIASFIENLDLTEEEKLYLLSLTPYLCIGEAENLAKLIDEALRSLLEFKIN